MADRMRVGGVVLCGGVSQRMGLAKATLPFGPETLLTRVVRLLGEVVEPIVVVAAAGQSMPQLPACTIVTCDERSRSGPLEGLRVGLAAIADHADAAYVTSCDVPLLARKFIARMTAELGAFEAAVPVDEGFYHPLAAVYRADLVPRIERQLMAGNRKMSELFGMFDTNHVPLDLLRDGDPDLLSLMNVNTPGDYARALNLAGFQLEPTVRTDLGL